MDQLTENLLVSNPGDLGFEPITDRPHAWSKIFPEGLLLVERMLTMEQLLDAEILQREVFGVTDYDLLSAGELLTAIATGGDQLRASFTTNGEEKLAAISIGFGGWVDGKPRLISDFLAVRHQFRSLGLGSELKRLQAVLAIERGFAEIAWTVDPLRAANAHLNFNKLGAYARDYEIDRYGSGFAEDLYGGLPTDRLQIIWPLRSFRVQRLLAGLPDKEWNVSDRSQRIPLPVDIDALIQTDRDAALAWRLQLRSTLAPLLDAGLVIHRFLPPAQSGNGEPALLLSPWEEVANDYEEKTGDA